jgi:hypothetical protein
MRGVVHHRRRPIEPRRPTSTGEEGELAGPSERGPQAVGLQVIHSRPTTTSRRGCPPPSPSRPTASPPSPRCPAGCPTPQPTGDLRDAAGRLLRAAHELPLPLEAQHRADLLRRAHRQLARLRQALEPKKSAFFASTSTALKPTAARRTSGVAARLVAASRGSRREVGTRSDTKPRRPGSGKSSGARLHRCLSPRRTACLSPRRGAGCETELAGPCRRRAAAHRGGQARSAISSPQPRRRR